MQNFLYTLSFSFLLSADACHMHRDQVDPSYPKAETKHHLTVSRLMRAPLGNIEEPYEKDTATKECALVLLILCLLPCLQRQNFFCCRFLHKVYYG